MSRAFLGGLRRKRGTRVWVFLLGMALFSAAGWLRMTDALDDWYWLEQVANVSPGPQYLIATGAAWGIVALLTLVWIFFLRPGWRIVGLITAVFLAATYWADRLLLTRAEGGFYNAGFAAMLTTLGLLYAVFALVPWKGKGTDGIQRSGS